jgi:hypothetical protein
LSIKFCEVYLLSASSLAADIFDTTRSSSSSSSGSGRGGGGGGGGGGYINSSNSIRNKINVRVVPVSFILISAIFLTGILHTFGIPKVLRLEFHNMGCIWLYISRICTPDD